MQSQITSTWDKWRYKFYERESDINVHRQGIAQKVGLYGRAAFKKPHLRKVKKLPCLEWARKYIYWIVEEWEKFIFIDEMKCKMFGNRYRRVYVRRCEKEKIYGRLHCTNCQARRRFHNLVGILRKWRSKRFGKNLWN